MKLAKRISIALLAACVVGGSAVAMAACGGSTPEPTPSSEPTIVTSGTEDVITDSGLVDDQIDTSSEESASSEGEEQDAPSAGIDYSGAYLRTFQAVPFQAAMKDAVNRTYGPNDRVEEIEVLWYDDWDSLKNYSTSERPSEADLAEGWVPVGCRIKLDWDPLSDNDPEKFDMYLIYNAQENTLDVMKVNVYFDTDHRFMDQDESLNAVMQLLAILDLN